VSDVMRIAAAWTSDNCPEIGVYNFNFECDFLKLFFRTQPKDAYLPDVGKAAAQVRLSNFWLVMV
jgi:hypothetical protein